MLHTPLLMSTKRPTTDDSSSSKSINPDNSLESAGLKLLTLLLQCAECVSSNNLNDAVFTLLPEITHLSSPYGNSPQRVAAYFSHALHSRVINTFLHNNNNNNKTLTQFDKIFNALQCFNSITPIIKFSHFTANQAIFETLNGCNCECLHIVDLDIMQGLQWPGLFHILATRRRKIRSLRVTGFGSSAELLNSTGRRLGEFASSLGLPFVFNPIEGKIGNLVDLGRIRGVRRDEVEEEEVVVVHMMQHCLYDITGSDTGMLRLLGLLRPRLITIVEQDLGRGSVGFLERFVEALHYYSALFDAVGDGLDEESVERHMVERELFGVEIRNVLGNIESVGCGVRVERWGEELRRVGFREVSLGGSPAAQAGLLLGMFPWKGYTLLEEKGCLKLGWKDLSLLTASAWEPIVPSD